MATSGPLNPFLRQPSRSPSPSLSLHPEAPCNPSNPSTLESYYPTQQAAFTTHRSVSPVATASSVSSTSLAPSPTTSESHQSNNSTTPFMASVLTSRQLPLPVPQRRQSTPLMGQKTLSSQRQSSADLTSPNSPSHQPMSSSPHFRAWQPTRSFSHDVTTTASSTSTAAEQQQKRQLASQLQYLHELDQMHRQRIRDIQRLHEQQQLFTSPHHRHSRHYKPAAPSRPYHDVGSASHETYSQQQHQQYQQQHAHGPPPSSPSQNNRQATAGSKGQGMVAQPITPQPNMPRAEVSAAAWSNEQHAPRPDHYVRRFQLAQRMLQIQQILHTQRIQQLHFMHKLSKVQQQQNQQQSVPELVVSTPTLPSSPSSPTATNTSTVVALPQCKSKGDLFQDKRGSQGIPTVETRRVSSVPDISRISLPNVDTIRKQRRQRLKAQARLRQAAAERSLKAAGAATEVDVKNDGSDAHSTVKEETISTGNTLVGSVTSGALSDKGDEAVKLASFSSVYTPTLTLPLASAQQRQINKSGDAALRLSDCSISRARLKTKAELAYKKQLVRQQTLQHHMIQDHTNRYRIYQAYCLLQRAREAQAMDELKVIELKQVQTRAWVESLRSQADMEVPK